MTNDQTRVEKWDRRFIALAKHIATWSKDPSTTVGAVIVDSRNRLISVGYNGFAQGVEDRQERYADRDTKYKIIIHGEMNAIIFAQRDLSGCTLYTHPFAPCSACAAMVIQSGISRCVFPETPEHLKERWGASFILATQMFQEAGVEVVEYGQSQLEKNLNEIVNDKA